ncbi:MAG: HD domain-containing phosphohydrolase [Planctomycetota bacterium]
MEAALIPTIGMEGTEEVRLEPGEPVILGRGEDADIQLMQSKVSRIHCRISYENGFYAIEDLDSRNGTWVNNRRIHKAILFHHDRLTIGNNEFRFVLEAGMSEDSTQLPLRGDSDIRFGTEIREPAREDLSSSLFFSFPGTEQSEKAQNVEKELAAVLRVINCVNAEHRLERLLETIMDNVMDVIEADRGYLISARKVNGVLMPLVSRNKESLPSYARNTFSRSIVGECYETGDSILMADPTTQHDISESIVSQNIQSIMCVPLRDGEGPVGVLYVDRIIGSDPFSQRELKLLTAIGNQAGIAIRRAQLSRQVESLFRDAMRTVINLIEVKDEYTYGHSERVTGVALAISELCGLDKSVARDIELAGLLHDVGKLAIKLDVLQKPASLTDSEYEDVKKHPVVGEQILKDVENAENIAKAVRYHHEWWDGKGYPDGLSGEDIPLLARILAIADAFDSMTAGRPYKRPMTEEEIRKEFRDGAGTQFDPVIGERFVAALQNDGDFRRQINVIYRRKGQETPREGPFP